MIKYAGDLEAHRLEFQSPNLEECIHPAFRKMCSFCDETFPLHPLEQLKRMDQAVKANPLVRCRWEPKNPSALQFPVSKHPFALTTDYCQLHHSEMSIIPQGLELGWPSQIDLDLLRFYGIKGYDVIYKTLLDMFLSPSAIDNTSFLGQPLAPDYLIRKVFIPETALCLIAEALKPCFWGCNVFR
ncbi:uncharacterized protein VP01_5815g2 [Puccinia sorghi]|uniref:Uncharacterized protein n=1 Tax=Puccinia sorghi TaxID=27349 RepID=A0A0L6UI86_9BASI|nr:uncharacterized protein VP01_5815g2 [Puccinia sorghi]